MSAINNKRIQARQTSIQGGFILLPVVLAITLVAAAAYLMNVDGAMNVNSLGKEAEYAQARYIAMAGLDHMLWQANKANCTGYSNLTNAAFGINKYSATFTPTSGSPVSISVTGSHANGASYSIQRDRVKVYQTPATQVLQPNAAASKDTQIYAFKPTLNYGGDIILSVTRWGGKNYRSLLQFDLSSLIGKAKIISAKLELYQNYNLGVGPVGVHRVVSPWVEGTQSPGAVGPGATWNLRDTALSWTTPGGDYAANVVATISATGIAWTASDITALVNDWVAGTYANNGMMLVPETASSDAYFASSENGNPLYAPKLSLNYACECGNSCANPPITTTLNPVADAFIDNQSAIKNYGAATSMKITFVSSTDQKRSVLRFDTSAIPNGALIQSAKLRLNVASVLTPSTNPKTISAYALTQTWVQGTKAGSGTADGVSWNTSNGSTAWATAGGTYRTPSVAMAVVDSSGISPPPASFTTGWLFWDVTALAQEWVDGVTVNNGVLLISTVKDEQLIDSKEKGGLTIPQLVITYTAP